jgi:hypothetical protein
MEQVDRGNVFVDDGDEHPMGDFPVVVPLGDGNLIGKAPTTRDYRCGSIQDGEAVPAREPELPTLDHRSRTHPDVGGDGFEGTQQDAGVD